jgi:hypothetical protein
MNISRYNIAYVLVIINALVAIFFPSSIHTNIIPSLYTIQVLLITFISLITALLIGNTKKLLLLIALLIPSFLVIFTILSPLDKITVGSILGYVGFSSILLVNFRQLKKPYKSINYIVMLITIVHIFFGYLLFLGNEFVFNLIQENYSAFYPELFENMVIWYSKPVIFYGTHSLAAFFYFILFYINFNYYKSHNKILFLISSILLIPLMFLLLSTSGILFGVFSIVYVIKGNSSLTYISMIKIISIVLIAGMLFSLSDYYIMVSKLIENSSGSGLIGRFSHTGTLVRNLDYIANNPFSPIGLKFSEKLWMGDSGIVEYILRGSILLLLLMYLGYFIFCFRNLKNYDFALFLFILILMFESGYTILTYARFFGLLPFIIIALNNISYKNQKR